MGFMQTSTTKRREAMNIIELAIKAGGKHVIEMPCEYYKLTDENLTKFAELLQAHNQRASLMFDASNLPSGEISNIELHLGDNVIPLTAQQQASEPVAWISNDVKLPLIKDGSYWLYPSQVDEFRLPLYTSPTNTQAIINTLNDAITEDKILVAINTELQAKLDKAREALQKLRTETHDVYEGVGEKALINKLVNAGHIVDMTLKEIE